MSVYTDFRRFVNDLEASATFKGWCTAQSADCTNWKTYRTGLLTLTPPPAAPALATNFGKALVDVGVMAVDAGLVAPPPLPPLTAAFTYAASGLTVSFNDASTPGPSGSIIGWHWDFGDGATSNLQHPPPHTYAGANTYPVTLTVTGTPPDGTDPVTENVPVSSGGGGTVWESDATTAALDPSSASKVSAFLSYCGPLAYFFPEVGAVTVPPGNAGTYRVDTSLTNVGNFVNPVYILNGAKTGLSNDGHLAVIDNDRDLWHDFDLAGQLLSGQVKTWVGGASMKQDSGQVPGRVSGHTGQSATAAGFPLLQGVITVAEVLTGVIPHALAFSAANIGPRPSGGNPYPAVSWSAGYTSGNQPPGSSIVGHIPLGTWMRVDPAADISALSGFEHMVMLALQHYGMFCRDRGSALTLHGVDVGGGGASFAAWRAAGVPLSTTGTVHFSATFVSLLRAHLQVLVAPIPS